ncbi:elongation factor 1-delta isoform X1 [Gadus morhua]|uniref:Eukaryotic translation elongation factor 1 delta a (guanine nucleotide exchange protein) n=1 Tax=Gadus morhua TaxID=8049 RepID=A0A8C5ATF3_GADMO|nr:elongation factor 1-delta-like isoform X1 [Gadus morhua]
MDQSKASATQGGTPQIAIPGRQASGGPAVERVSAGAQSGSANGTLSSSPRSSGAKGPYAPRGGAKLPKGPKQGNPDKENGAAKSPAAPRRPAGRGRNRTSSESERGGKGSRGPAQRKRGLSETEGRPWPRDNINMSGLQCLATENIWFDKHRYDDAERCFYEGANGSPAQEKDANAILQEIAKSRQQIQQCLDEVKSATQPAKGRQAKRPHRNSSSKSGDQDTKGKQMDYQSMQKEIEDMRALIRVLESRVTSLEKTQTTAAPAPCVQAAKVQAAPQRKAVVDEDDDDDDDDDDLDLFGSDDEDAETLRIKQERIDAYAAKKSKKPALIAKSSILLDVKPWDDETDMVKLEECVRSVQADGLLWGASKLLPVGYGIRKLQINCVVEDDKVGTDLLEEEITKFEDYIQSVDVAAFNKI